jgi:hypothetical protein
MCAYGGGGGGVGGDGGDEPGGDGGITRERPKMFELNSPSSPMQENSVSHCGFFVGTPTRKDPPSSPGATADDDNVATPGAAGGKRAVLERKDKDSIAARRRRSRIHHSSNTPPTLTLPTSGSPIHTTPMTTSTTATIESVAGSADLSLAAEKSSEFSAIDANNSYTPPSATINVGSDKMTNTNNNSYYTNVDGVVDDNHSCRECKSPTCTIKMTNISKSGAPVYSRSCDSTPIRRGSSKKSSLRRSKKKSSVRSDSSESEGRLEKRRGVSVGRVRGEREGEGGVGEVHCERERERGRGGAHSEGEGGELDDVSELLAKAVSARCRQSIAFSRSRSLTEKRPSSYSHPSSPLAWRDCESSRRSSTASSVDGAAPDHQHHFCRVR